MKEQIEEMARVICASDILCHTCGESTYTYCAEAIAEALYNAGYRKQIKGEWIEHDDDWCGAFYTCSVCGCDWTTIDGTPQENNMRFCPECGAKMKGGAE